MTTQAYKNAGVDIEKGYDLVKRISKGNPAIGGFSGAFDLGQITKDYKHPILVSGTDGVGTKLKIAIERNEYETIGTDLVAMVVNDIITSGATPLFLLDYFATGVLDVDIAEKVILGIQDACVYSGVELLGGETAEMPGMYFGGDFDMAAFAVGVVDKSEVIDGSDIKQGDFVYGIKSSGFHSNGYSLLRKLRRPQLGNYVTVRL